MTTEDDFQRVLVTTPRDWQTRLRGDSRAEGYRAMGLRQFAPAFFSGADKWFWFNAHWASGYRERTDDLSVVVLPDDWYDLLPYMPRPPQPRCALGRSALRESLDDAAHAFARLPPPRRAERLDLRAIPE